MIIYPIIFRFFFAIFILTQFFYCDFASANVITRFLYGFCKVGQKSGLQMADLQESRLQKSVRRFDNCDRT